MFGVFPSCIKRYRDGVKTHVSVISSSDAPVSPSAQNSSLEHETEKCAGMKTSKACSFCQDINQQNIVCLSRLQWVERTSPIIYSNKLFFVFVFLDTFRTASIRIAWILGENGA